MLLILGQIGAKLGLFVYSSYIGKESPDLPNFIQIKIQNKALLQMNAKKRGQEKNITHS